MEEVNRQLASRACFLSQRKPQVERFWADISQANFYCSNINWSRSFLNCENCEMKVTKCFPWSFKRLSPSWFLPNSTKLTNFNKSTLKRTKHVNILTLPGQTWVIKAKMKNTNVTSAFLGDWVRVPMIVPFLRFFKVYRGRREAQELAHPLASARQVSVHCFSCLCNGVMTCVSFFVLKSEINRWVSYLFNFTFLL